jgi:hypothetical protein
MKFVINSQNVKEEVLAFIHGIDVSSPVVLSVEIKQHKNARTRYQNAYYFGVVLRTISEYTGFTPEELHASFKRTFLPIEREMIGGVMVERLSSTKDLDTKTFNDYLERILHFCAENIGLYVPMPNEMIYPKKPTIKHHKPLKPHDKIDN